MATHFESLTLDRPDLFGVTLSGTVSPGDKERLRELAAKCLKHGQVQVIMDLSGLGALGGGGAGALADFQAQLVGAGGGSVFVGAGEVMRHFLEQKFVDVPLVLYETVDEALVAIEAESPGTTVTAAPEPTPEAIPAAEEATPTDAMDDVLDEVEAAPKNAVLRKANQYTSLSDALEALGAWSDTKDHAEFSQALANLLFSHGLAGETVLLARRGDEFVDAGGERRVPASGGFAQTVASINRPLTLLDIPAEDLDDEDATLLEALAPDVILPVIREDTLAAMVLLQREGEDHDYNVAENFALELLMRVLNSREVSSGDAVLDADHDDSSTWEPDGTTAAEVLLQLALDLPEAVDRPHFWRIFSRHCWPVLPIAQLGFLGQDRVRPQLMAGGNDSWMGLELSGEKLQLFLQTMERPVAVENMPSFFKTTRDALRQAGAEWIVALKWEGKFIGTVLIQLDPGYGNSDPTELLEELFIETSRLLARYHDTNDSADVNLELVRVLISQAEKNHHGSDSQTATMVKQVGRLARVMAFPPDQERDMIYGCLLRDIGLMDKTVDFPQGDRNWTQEQREIWRSHPDEGSGLLVNLGLPATITDVVRSHHERYDGRGFPRGLDGHNIPLVARVVSIAECYSEMITGTDGQTPLSPVAAAELLRREAGSRFDPDLVELFLKAVLPSGPRSGHAVAFPPVLEPAG